MEKLLSESNESRNVLFRKYNDLKTQQNSLQYFKKTITSVVAGNTLSHDSQNINFTFSPQQDLKKSNNSHHQSVITSPPLSSSQQGPIHLYQEEPTAFETPKNSILSHSKFVEEEEEAEYMRNHILNNSSEKGTNHEEQRTIVEQELLNQEEIHTFLNQSNSNNQQPTQVQLSRRPSPRRFSQEVTAAEQSVDAKTLYSQVRTALDPEEFKEFVTNLKMLNRGEQTASVTLAKIQEIFRPERKYLYQQFASLIQAASFI